MDIYEQIIGSILQQSARLEPHLRSIVETILRSSSSTPRNRLVCLYEEMSSLTLTSIYPDRYNTISSVYRALTDTFPNFLRTEAEVFIRQVEQENRSRYRGLLEELEAYAMWEGCLRYLNIAHTPPQNNILWDSPSNFLLDFLFRFHRCFRHGRRRNTAFLAMRWEPSTLTQRRIAFRNLLTGRDLLENTGIISDRRNRYSVRVLLGLMCFLYVDVHNDQFLDDVPISIRDIVDGLLHHLRAHHGGIRSFEAYPIEELQDTFQFFIRKTNAYFSCL